MGASIAKSCWATQYYRVMQGNRRWVGTHCQDANIQERRNWDLLIHEKLQPLLASPRAKKKSRSYVEVRRQTSATEAGKQAMLQKLTNLKEDGGELTGGSHKDTYDHKMKSKIKNKCKKKEEAAKAEEIKKTKKKLGILKMVATKLKKKKKKKKKKETEKALAGAAEGAPASASSAAAAGVVAPSTD